MEVKHRKRGRIDFKKTNRHVITVWHSSALVLLVQCAVSCDVTLSSVQMNTYLHDKFAFDCLTALIGH